ncbi:hypothetical protein GF391_01245 [Candidatus Uhrbacteria bacterium]|nr:hypothetical protein [Candidatus Uhrbacteria bacterium]
MPARPIFRSDHTAVKRQSRAEEDKAAFAKQEAGTARQIRPVMRVAQPRQLRLDFVRPEHEWIEEAAARAVELKPRPQQLHMIRDFRRVSYKYARIQMSAHGWYRDPVEALIYHCLMDRLEEARIAIEDPGSELRRLEERAIRKGWPNKVLNKRRAQLIARMSNRDERLDMSQLLQMMRQMQSKETKKGGVKQEIRRLWRKAKRRHRVRKSFPKQLEKLQNRMQALDDEGQKLKLMSWVEWLDGQARKAIFDIEEDIVRMAEEGRVLKDELPRGRKAVRSKTGLWRPRNVMVVADLDEDWDVLRVLAVVTPAEYNKKRNRRVKGGKPAYRNRPPRSQRYR